MGISMMGKCRCYPKNSNVVAPNPNPLNFKILSANEVHNNIVATIQYPDCTNFEGEKILVFLNMTFKELCAMTSIDPHFADNDKAPFARFKPNKRGFEAAIMVAESMK